MISLTPLLMGNPTSRSQRATSASKHLYYVRHISGVGSPEFDFNVVRTSYGAALTHESVQPIPVEEALQLRKEAKSILGAQVYICRAD